MPTTPHPNRAGEESPRVPADTSRGVATLSPRAPTHRHRVGVPPRLHKREMLTPNPRISPRQILAEV